MANLAAPSQRVNAEDPPPVRPGRRKEPRSLVEKLGRKIEALILEHDLGGGEWYVALVRSADGTSKALIGTHVPDPARFRCPTCDAPACSAPAGKGGRRG